MKGVFFFNQLEPVTTWEYFIVFLIGFGCFLIGWFFSALNTKSRYKKLLDECNSKKKKVIDETKDFVYAQTTFETSSSRRSGLRAIKTRERSGKLVETSAAAKELDFKNIGIAKASEKNDLKRIKGIGPFIEKKLNTIGVFTFAQISKFQKEDIEAVTELISFFPGRIERDDWKGQAKVLMKNENKDFSNRMNTNNDE